jgi:hypothetical protein
MRGFHSVCASRMCLCTRYIYHNSEEGIYFETAADVVANHQGSAFVKGLETRPKALNMGPIPSTKEECAHAAGKWSPCGQVETCSVLGKVVFSRSCQRPCHASAS